MKACASVFTLLLVTQPGFAQFRASVSAGGSERRDTPVFVDMELAGLPEHPWAIAASGGRPAPTQVEKLGPNKVRVWWVVDHLPAGFQVSANPSMVISPVRAS